MPGTRAGIELSWLERERGAMTGEQGYNGWTNYPTWNVALWLDNDQFLQMQMREIAVTGGSAYDAAQSLRVFVDGLVEDIAPAMFGASFAADIFGWALEQVDWLEIARNILEDVTEDA